MYLVTSATEMEMIPFVQALSGHDPHRRLVTGVGPVETAYSLTRKLMEDRDGGIEGVLNFGVAGAYTVVEGAPGADLLDICLADQEVLGDLGICFDDRIEEFSSENVPVHTRFSLDSNLTTWTAELLEQEGIPCRRGVFVTVSGVSGTAKRGAMISKGVGGLCENMEGGAAARVCRSFDLPLVELRCISNFVEDRDVSKWRLSEACEKAGRAAALVARALGTRKK